MSVWTWPVVAAALATAFALLVRRKLRRDAIVQNGANVGSAMLAQIVSPGMDQARFIIVRGEPAFQATEPFEHQGMRFRILSYSRLDESSTVLRRFLDVTCGVEPGRDVG
jgi:hypothetical protein